MEFVDNKKWMIVYTVYEKPQDYPTEFVVREWFCGGDNGEVRGNNNIFLRKKTLEEIRRNLIRLGLTCIGRKETDDPVIVESWV